jgi:septation ring formation regulator EzrA
MKKLMTIMSLALLSSGLYAAEEHVVDPNAVQRAILTNTQDLEEQFAHNSAVQRTILTNVQKLESDIMEHATLLQDTATKLDTGLAAIQSKLDDLATIKSNLESMQINLKAIRNAQ